MDIRAGIIAAVVLSIIGALWIFRSGVRALRSASKLTFYRIKRERERGGWFTLFAALLFLSFALWLSLYGEPIAYRYFPPSPTSSLTPTLTTVPTITLSPTITSTPTITFTPAITDTPPFTSTPFIPLAIEALFESVVTPNPNAAFSPLQFTLNCTNFLNFEAAAVFQNPIRYMCAVFTYAEMIPGSQWTALWFRDGELVHYETIPWDGETGGYGFTEWEAPPEEFLPGNYEVQIFVGLEWKVVGQFLLQGDSPTSVPTVSVTISPSPAVTQTPAPPLPIGTAVTGTP
jgi:type VI secretion system secreted protein VgrG